MSIKGDFEAGLICPLCGRTKARPWDRCVCLMKNISPPLGVSSQSEAKIVEEKHPWNRRQWNYVEQLKGELAFFEKKFLDHVTASIKAAEKKKRKYVDYK